MHKQRRVERFRKYLDTEVQVEYKACLYFFCILFFYCCYLLFQQVYAASILHMAEMIFSAYVIGYIQVCLLGNFDEAERFGARELLSAMGCTAVYALLSYVCGWFDKKIGVTIGFAAFLLIGYGGLLLVNKIKRGTETRKLNEMLRVYKKGEEERKENVGESD